MPIPRRSETESMQDLELGRPAAWSTATSPPHTPKRVRKTSMRPVPRGWDDKTDDTITLLGSSPPRVRKMGRDVGRLAAYLRDNSDARELLERTCREHGMDEPSKMSVSELAKALGDNVYGDGAVVSRLGAFLQELALECHGMGQETGEKKTAVGSLQEQRADDTARLTLVKDKTPRKYKVLSDTATLLGSAKKDLEGQSRKLARTRLLMKAQEGEHARVMYRVERGNTIDQALSEPYNHDWMETLTKDGVAVTKYAFGSSKRTELVLRLDALPAKKLVLKKKSEANLTEPTMLKFGRQSAVFRELPEDSDTDTAYCFSLIQKARSFDFCVRPSPERRANFVRTYLALQCILSENNVLESPVVTPGQLLWHIAVSKWRAQSGVVVEEESDEQDTADGPSEVGAVRASPEARASPDPQPQEGPQPPAAEEELTSAEKAELETPETAAVTSILQRKFRLRKSRAIKAKQEEPAEEPKPEEPAASEVGAVQAPTEARASPPPPQAACGPVEPPTAAKVEDNPDFS